MPGATALTSTRVDESAVVRTTAGEPTATDATGPDAVTIWECALTSRSTFVSTISASFAARTVTGRDASATHTQMPAARTASRRIPMSQSEISMTRWRTARCTISAVVVTPSLRFTWHV